jgi:hypothetical protein
MHEGGRDAPTVPNVADGFAHQDLEKGTGGSISFVCDCVHSRSRRIGGRSSVFSQSGSPSFNDF